MYIQVIAKHQQHFMIILDFLSFKITSFSFLANSMFSMFIEMFGFSFSMNFFQVIFCLLKIYDLSKKFMI